MKKTIAHLIVVIASVSTLFRGLYFAVEASVFLSVIILLSLFYFFIKLYRNEPIKLSKPITIFGCLLIFAYSLSFINATNIRENIITLLQYIEYIIISIVLYDHFCDKKQQFGRIIMLSVIISGFINAVIGLEALTQAFSFLNVTLNASGLRIGATFQYANTAAIYFVVCLIFIIALINSTDKIVARIILTGMGSTIMLAMLLTGSRGGYIAAFIIIIAFIFIQPAKYKIKTFGSLICITVSACIFISRISKQIGSHEYYTITKYLIFSFVIAVFLGFVFEIIKLLHSKLKIKPIVDYIIIFALICAFAVVILVRGISSIIPSVIISRFEDLIKYGIHDRNIYLRLEYYKAALRLIRENWLIGLGGGSWTSLYYSVQSFFYTAKVTHNHYLQVFIESGILGFFSFCAITLSSLLYMLKSMFIMKETNHKLLLTGLACGFFALAAHSAIDFNLTFVSISLLFWILITVASVFLPEKNGELKKKKPYLIAENNYVRLIMVIICSCLVTFMGLYTVSAQYSEKGYKAMSSKKYDASKMYYDEAARLDPINPANYYQLAKLYKYFAGNSKEQSEKDTWRQAAIDAAEKSVELDHFYPEYRELLTQVYFDAGMPLAALDSAEKLIQYQPCKSSNYELVAKGYIETAVYHINKNDYIKGKALLLLCSNISELPYVEINEKILFYQNEATKLLKEIGK